jgi:Tfp pilus assembly protein PilZ/ActR/RegA family two-component response regulator
MNAERSLLVVGFREDAATPFRAAAAAVGIPAAVTERQEDLAGALDDVQPLAIVVRLSGQSTAQAFATVRSQARFAQVPIFGVPPERNDLAFTELFVWGGDDVVTAAVDPVVRRLRPLCHPAPPLKSADPPPAKDQAIVAGSDATWRTVMGRALYNGGFAVSFATSSDGLVDECLKQSVRVVVAQDDLQPGGALAAMQSARERNAASAWVLAAPPKRMAAVMAAAKPLGKSAVVDGFAPPENALFIVNELLAARGVDKRATARLLYGTSVAFRPAGRDEDEVGFSYNVNAGGVYVRTLAPLDAGTEVWLEMWSPRSERRVRLAGKVAWKRPFGPVGGATVPAGFGVQITHGLAGDLERWRAGYHAFAESLLGTSAKPG